MAFTELELKRIDKLIGAFCQNRVSERARTQLRYSYRVKGQDVILAEERPRWDKPEEWLTLDFAKAKYVKSRKLWKLYWMRASGKWEPYKPSGEHDWLEGVIEAIENDQYGCFFG